MFDDPRHFLWLIPAMPLAASVLCVLLGLIGGRRLSHWPCVLAALASCAASFHLLMNFVPAGLEPFSVNWFASGDLSVSLSLRADGLTAIMLVTVTFVGSLIAIYSIGYMHGDAGYARYFAQISLFLFSMTGLVLADNFILLYAFWEGVGLCSYLLIGFWFTRPSAAAAARKAFLVTRLGDVGLFLGIMLLWHHFQSVDFAVVFGAQSAFAFAAQAPGALQAACLLLLCGAIGKSAQFPLHVWLPDAMEGPSPVSALIHAATMVTAGVYLVARCTPLFVLSPDAQLVVATIGGFTALLAALTALTQTDLKRVLAYSTISQLGYMFLALGAGLRAENLMIVAVTAAIFHLFTHAFFKALLFLAAGSVMHAMGNVIDMTRFGGLRRLLRHTHWTFLCGAAALAGVPLLSGFWSKDLILEVVQEAGAHHVLYRLLFIGALITAALTAFYTFRAYFLTFWGEERIPPEAGAHAHESPPIMLVPLMILAVAALGVGIAVQPLSQWFLGKRDWFAGVLDEYWLSRALAGLRAPGVAAEHATNWPLLIGSSALVGLGILAAWWMYVLRPQTATQLARLAPVCYRLSYHRFYLDAIYHAVIVKPLAGFAVLCRFVDQYVIDGVVDLFGQVPRFAALVFRPIQNGLVQFYALLMVLGIAVLLSVLLRN
jgi:proton-translocating NADH-quinone oxidoreductase chain L